MKSLYFATVLLFSLVEEEFSLAKNLPRLFWHKEYDAKKNCTCVSCHIKKITITPETLFSEHGCQTPFVH